MRDLKADLQEVYADMNRSMYGEQKYIKIEVAREWLERAIKAEEELKKMKR